MRYLKPVVATATSVKRENWRDNLRQRAGSGRDRDGNLYGFVIAFPRKLNPTALPRTETTLLLAQLEAENAKLRDRAVELALEIQAMAEGPLR